MNEKELLQRAFPSMPQDCYETMLAAARGVEEETKMKRKIPVALVIALLLLLMVGAAFALSHFQENVKRIAEIETAYGRMDLWPLENRIEVIRMLADDGALARDAHVEALLSGTLSDEEAGRLTIRMLIEFASVPFSSGVGYSEVGLQQIMWNLGLWSDEDKAFYSQIMQEAGVDSDLIYLLPEKGDLSLEEAERIAREAIGEAYDLAESELEALSPIWHNFYTVKEAPDDRRWLLAFDNPLRPFQEDGDGIFFGHLSVGVSAITGEIVTDTFAYDIPRQAEREKESLFYQDDPLYTAIAAFEGHPDKLTPESGEFYLLSLEKKAAWSREMRPMILTAYEENPERYGEDLFTLSKTACVYGLPDDESIGEAEARGNAIRAILESTDISEAILSTLHQYTYYDITDPSTPLWKFYFSSMGIEGAEDVDKGYKVEMDARTGDILRMLVDTGTYADALDKFLIWL